MSFPQHDRRILRTDADPVADPYVAVRIGQLEAALDAEQAKNAALVAALEQVIWHLDENFPDGLWYYGTPRGEDRWQHGEPDRDEVDHGGAVSVTAIARAALAAQGGGR